MTRHAPRGRAGWPVAPIFLGGLDQTQISLVDEIEKRNVGVSVALGIRNHEPKVGFDQLPQCVLISLMDTPRELDLTLVDQRWVAPNLFEVATKSRHFGIRR